MVIHAQSRKGMGSLNHKVRYMKQCSYGTFIPKPPQLSPKVATLLHHTPYRAVCYSQSSIEAELEMCMIHNTDSI